MRSRPSLPPLAWLALAAALVWHVLNVLRPGPEAGQAGAAFASQFYAARVALEGGDPYDPGALASVAAVDEVARRLPPVPGPPPLLAATVPLVPLGRAPATALWIALQELSLVVCAGLLARRAAPVGGPWTAPLTAALVGATYAVTLAISVGHAHFLALALALAADEALDRRPRAAGALLGAALAVSPVPALVLALWFSHGRWRALGAAAATWLLASAAALPLVAWSHQLSYYAATITPGAWGPAPFGDLSLLHLWHAALPGVGGISGPARLLTGLTGFGLLAGTFLAFRDPPASPLQRATQASAVLLLPLLVAVWCDESRLAYALPALLFVLLGYGRGALGAGWIAALGPAVAVLVYEQPPLESFGVRVITEAHPVAFWLFDEAKAIALVTVWAAAVRLGARSDDPSRPPTPTPAV